MTVPKSMTGRVVARDGYRFEVACDTAVEHLQTLWLESWAVRSAKVGDRVRVEYRKTGRGYEWVVAEVLTEEK